MTFRIRTFIVRAIALVCSHAAHVSFFAATVLDGAEIERMRVFVLALYFMAFVADHAKDE